MLRWVYTILYVVVTIACAAPASAQRVYARAETSLPTVALVRTVSSATSAVDDDITTASSISVLVAITGVNDAYQNIKFLAADTAKLKKSPVYLRFSVDGLGSILGRVEIGKSLNNVIGSLVYTGTSLLSLLGLSSYTSGTAVTAMLPVGSNFDGIKLSMAANILTELKIYGAFYITPPSLSNLNVCSGDNVVIPISNFNSGYTYRLYDQASGGTLKTSSTTNSLTLPPITGNTTYYVEAVDSGTYLSVRIPILVNVVSKITPLVQLAN